MKHHRLGKSELLVSELGFGASPFGGVFGPIDEQEGIRAVHKALECGVTFFDVAPYYGLTQAETVLGRALRGIPRDSYVLSTKVGRYGFAEFDFSRRRVQESLSESLHRLGVDYVDLLLCHDVEFGEDRQIVEEAIPALHALKEQGMARAVGISGLPLVTLERFVTITDLDVVLSYCHYTLFDTSLLDLLPILQSKDVGVINAAPLGMGLLAQQPVPEWHPAPEPLRRSAERAGRLAQVQGVPLQKLALQFALQAPGVATTLVGMATPEQVVQNVACVGESIDQEVLAAVRAILAGEEPGEIGV
jgi:aryl-alcohol dehydrogenase-like predicted oxidoreductase